MKISNFFKKSFDFFSLKSYNQSLEDETANEIFIGCSRKQVGSVNTEND